MHENADLADSAGSQVEVSVPRPGSFRVIPSQFALGDVESGLDSNITLYQEHRIRNPEAWASARGTIIVAGLSGIHTLVTLLNLVRV